MKKIEELGISPWPWKIINDDGVFADVYTTKDGLVADSVAPVDARLIAAAPKLYEFLREAVCEYCHECGGGTVPAKCPKAQGTCFIQKWRAALAKAAGESEVEKQKSKIEHLSDWDWTTLVAAWRYYEHRHTIASASFPRDIINRYFCDTKTYGDGVRYQIARQFVKIDHSEGPDAIDGWPGDDSFGECDRRAWRLFYWFLLAWCYKNWRTLHVWLSNGMEGDVECFCADGRWYAKDSYIKSECVAPYKDEEIVK